MELLSGRDFQVMLCTNFVLDFGYYMRSAAQSWVMFELTDQQLWVGLANGVRVVPVLALSPFGGVLSDRVDRRHILFAVRAGLAAIVVLTGWLIVADALRAWHLVALSVGIGAVISFGNPAYYAFMYDLVGKSRLWAANSMASVVSNGGAIAGPAAAGVVLAGTGAAAVYFIAGGLYLAGAVGVLAIRPAPVKPAGPRAPVLRELREAVRYIRRTPHIAWLLAITLGAFAHSAFQPLLPLYARDVLKTGAAGFGLLTGAFGVGLFAGATLLALMPDVTKRGRVVLAAALAGDAAMALFGFSRLFPLSLALVFVIGFASAYWGNALVTMLQTMSSDEMRGRVMSIFSIAAEFGALGWLAGGALAQAIGNEEALVAAAAAGAGVTLLAFAASPVLRRS